MRAVVLLGVVLCGGALAQARTGRVDPAVKADTNAAMRAAPELCVGMPIPKDDCETVAFLGYWSGRQDLREELHRSNQARRQPAPQLQSQAPNAPQFTDADRAIIAAGMHNRLVARILYICASGGLAIATPAWRECIRSVAPPQRP